MQVYFRIRQDLKVSKIVVVPKFYARDWTEFNPWFYSPDTFMMGRGKNRAEYVNLGVGFDIETTSTEIDGHKVAWCWHWQVCVGDDVFFGRHLKDAITLFDDLAVRFKGQYIICWIHNLSYEFGYLTEYMDFEDIFATAPNKPIKCRYKNVIFRCSYAFTNMSLHLLAKTYTRTQKAVGDLDYDVIRYPNSIVSLSEKYYNYCDVKILSEFWSSHVYKLYIDGKKRHWIPLTNTAKVRNDMQGRISNWKEYKKVYSSVYPSVDVYNIFRQCFYGGIVRANAQYWGQILTDVASRDRTSSYPAVQLHYEYPMGRFTRVNPTNWKKYDGCCKLLKIQFINLQSIAPVSIMAYDKADTSKDVILDNGRIYSASMVTIWGTNVDLDMWLRFYTGSYKVLECYISKSGRLCRFQIDSLVDFYEGKMTLKGVKGKEEEYLKSKNMLNANFGCCVQKHNDETLTYIRETGEWKADPIPYEQKRSEFLLYQVGVFITAYARYELLRAVYAIWQDDLKHGRTSAIVYMDTDSCKYLYRGGIYEHLFDELDADIEKKTIAACEFYKIPLTESLKKIGKWDLETLERDSAGNVSRETYESFITLGSKRYLHDGEPTISGLPVKGFKDYCEKMNVTPEQAFRCGTTFPPDVINKLAMTYTTTDIRHVIENDGETFITPRHYVHAQKVGFDLKISKDYKKFITEIAQETGKRGKEHV